MRVNLTKKEIVNSIYMQIGFSKKISENLLEDILKVIIDNLIKGGGGMAGGMGYNPSGSDFALFLEELMKRKTLG